MPANFFQAFRLLDSIAEIKDGKKWWALPLEDFEKGNPWTAVPNSVNVEMTGFAVLTMLGREDSKFEEAIPVVNWMLEQQNSQGGAITSFFYQKTWVIF
jgi:A-macroglobulin TED domain